VQSTGVFVRLALTLETIVALAALALKAIVAIATLALKAIAAPLALAAQLAVALLVPGVAVNALMRRRRGGHGERANDCSEGTDSNLGKHLHPPGCLPGWTWPARVPCRFLRGLYVPLTKRRGYFGEHQMRFDLKTARDRRA
jgi:hypothetical protein